MQDLAQDATIAAGIKIGNTTTISGVGITGGSGVLGKLAENVDAIASIGVLAGIVIGVIGLCIQWYYLAQRDKRERELKNK